MKKTLISKLLFVFISAFIFAGCSLPFQPPKKSGIQITITGGEKATAFLDGGHIGNTPLTLSDVKSGTYSLKLVPEDATKQPYVTTVTLNPGLLTAVNWTFGKTADESGGEIFELSELSDKQKAQLTLVTVPDNVIVKVDGVSKGFSPMSLEDLTEGAHVLTVVAPGYIERTSNPKLTKGYKLTVTLKLERESLTPTPTPTPNPEVSTDATKSAVVEETLKTPTPSTVSAETAGVISATTSVTPYVKVLDNPLGWLRVRAETSSSSQEVAKLSVGSSVPYLETQTGWYKIEYAKGKQGWISAQSQYTKLFQ